MRLSIHSDLHLEFGSSDKKITNTNESKVLILVGDVLVAKDIERREHFYKQELIAAADQFEHTIVIAGNHEYYGGNIQTVDEQLAEWYDALGIVYLQNQLIDIDGYRFIGTTLWSDIDPVHDFHVRNAMSDYRLIRYNDEQLTPDMVRNMFIKNLMWLESQMSCSETEIVITHMSPSYNSVAPFHRTGKSSFINSAFYSNLEHLIQEHKPRLWVHGHMHNSSDYMIDDTRVICNPCGYVNREYQENIWDNTHSVDI